MDPRCFTGLIALIAALAITPAFAQNPSTLSDDAIQNELYRLGSYRNPEGRHFGYRGRVRSSDYEVEMQMQQLDKQRMEDDQRQYNLLLDELNRRDGERQKAKWQAQLDAIDARAREADAANQRWYQQQQELLQAMERRSEQQRAESDAFWQEYKARQEESLRAFGKPLEPVVPPGPQPRPLAWPAQPAKPTTPLPEAYFPPLHEVMPRQ